MNYDFLMRKKLLTFIIFVFLILAMFLRFSNLENNDLYGDAGYELEAARQIN